MSDIETDQGSSSREALANAIASRLAANTRDISAEAQERANQEEKRKLRRIIYSGIERNNDSKLAFESVKVLQKLVKNILDHPGDEKYMQFKPTNSTIQRTLIAPKNTLEFAIALGFRADVKKYCEIVNANSALLISLANTFYSFQPFYIFNPTTKNIKSLKNGLECLDEYVQREEAKVANSKSLKETLKDAQEKQRTLVKLAYDDDRREKQLRDEMEKQRRDAVAGARERAALEPQATSEGLEDESDAPPPYPMPGGPPVSILPLRGMDASPAAPAANSSASVDPIDDDSEYGDSD